MILQQVPLHILHREPHYLSPRRSKRIIPPQTKFQHQYPRHLEDDCRKKKWEGGGGVAKTKEKAQVIMNTSNMQNVTSITNEDFSDYCTVPSKSSIPPSNPELSNTQDRTMN